MINQSIESTKRWISLICLFLNKTDTLSIFKTYIAIVLFNKDSVLLTFELSNETTCLMATIKSFTGSVL